MTTIIFPTHPQGGAATPPPSPAPAGTLSPSSATYGPDALIGDLVLYMGTDNAQVQWGSCADPRLHKVPFNRILTVVKVDIFSYHTKLTIRGFGMAQFPSAAFKKVTLADLMIVNATDLALRWVRTVDPAEAPPALGIRMGDLLALQLDCGCHELLIKSLKAMELEAADKAKEAAAIEAAKTPPPPEPIPPELEGLPEDAALPKRPWSPAPVVSAAPTPAPVQGQAPATETVATVQVTASP